MSYSKTPKVKVEGDGRYNDVFLDIPISSIRTDIDNSGSVITINSDTSVAEAVAMLAEHHWYISALNNKESSTVYFLYRPFCVMRFGSAPQHPYAT
jgi:hypothetical protein